MSVVTKDSVHHITPFLVVGLAGHAGPFTERFATIVDLSWRERHRETQRDTETERQRPNTSRWITVPDVLTGLLCSNKKADKIHESQKQHELFKLWCARIQEKWFSQSNGAPRLLAVSPHLILP